MSELPETMREYPVGGCRGIGYAVCLCMIGASLVLFFLWIMSSTGPF